MKSSYYSHAHKESNTVTSSRPQHASLYSCPTKVLLCFETLLLLAVIRQYKMTLK